MAEDVDNKYMRRCLDLAVGAEGLTRPNPVVGAVVVCDGRITGEGYHIYSGGPHAEVIAVNAVKDRSTLNRSTLYVSLEPCCHHGKTPPCTDMIISAEIPRIVVGTLDTSAKVSGKGIEILRAAGKEVRVGVLENECRWLNRRFFTWHEKKRPYIILKWAESSDGFIDLERRADSTPEPYWITGLPERVLVHKWRATEEAILVGGETIRKDNPRLNVRYWKGKDPLIVILSRSGNIENYLERYETKTNILTFTFKKDRIKDDVIQVVLESEDVAAEKICNTLYEMGIQSLIVEGGAVVLNHFISKGFWDEARIFKGFKEFKKGVKAPVIEGKVINELNFETSKLRIIVR